MAIRPVPKRALAVWAAVTFAAGVAAAATGGGAGPADQRVAAEGPAITAAPRAATTTTTSSTTTSVAVETTTTATSAPVVDTTAPPTTTTPPTAAPPAEEAPVTAPPTTEPPPAPTFSMSPRVISTAMTPGSSPLIVTSGEGCTGPGHVGPEYGVVGIVTTQAGMVFEGDYVPAAPGGHWESNMSTGEPGTHTHHYRCQRADGTALFEYAPIPFTVTP